jgi:hypothetical protein
MALDPSTDAAFPFSDERRVSLLKIESTTMSLLSSHRQLQYDVTSAPGCWRCRTGARPDQL